MNDSKDSNEEKYATDHNYDGITELNNPLPNWWLTIFYGTIIFAGIYYFYYELGSGPSLTEELNTSMESFQAVKAEAQAAAPKANQEGLEKLLASAAAIESGKTEYKNKCAACHADKGQGMIGPNLTDDYWLHGDGSLLSVYNVIKVGVPDKGMPPWEGSVSEENIQNLAAFIDTLKGSNPANAKKAEGTKY